MTVGMLRNLIKDVPDNARILGPDSDHNYRLVNVVVGTALANPESGWTEDFGEDITPEADFGARRTVLVIT